MKTIWISLGLVVSFALTPTFISAQHDSNEANTLFGGRNPISTEQIGFYVAPQYGFTYLDGSPTSLFHLRGGVTFRDKMSVGGFFNISMNQVNPQSETLSDVYMDYWSLGVYGEYTLFSKKIVHLSFPLFVGYGEVQMDNEDGEADLGESNFFQIEPSVLLEINLHKYVRFNLGAGYRIIGPMTYRNFNQSDISGFTGYVGFKFGLFR